MAILVPATRFGLLLPGARKLEFGAREQPFSAGAARQGPERRAATYFRESGVEHDVINANDFECAFIVVEFLES